MNHLEASNLLTHYLSGNSSPERRRGVEEHMAECAECAGWVATHSLFAEALVEHPSSDEIVVYALAPESLAPASHERCAKHLESCPECREEVELVREGVERSRAASEPVQEQSAGINRHRRVWVALAASLILVLGASLMLRTVDQPSVQQVLAESSLSGEKTILADRSIVVETTEVEPGGALRLESRVIGFGAGFSVKTGATLAVVTSDSIADDDSSSSSG